MKPSELTTVEGKNLSVSQKKTLGRLIENGLLAIEYNDQRALITHVNPFTGVEVKLTPLASAIADLIISAQRYEPDWNNLRMIFRLCWPDAYYKLID